MDRQAAIEKLNELMQGVHICLFTSLDEHGQLVSRPMGIQNKTFDGNMWFFTNEASAKLLQIATNPRVNVSFEHSNSYVSISGEAQALKDPALAEELWNPAMKDWFPDGPTSQELVLVRVQATSAQYWDSANSKAVTLFAYAKAAITGKRPSTGEIGEAEVVDLKP